MLLGGTLGCLWPVLNDRLITLREQNRPDKSSRVNVSQHSHFGFIRVIKCAKSVPLMICFFSKPIYELIQPGPCQDPFQFPYLSNFMYMQFPEFFIL